MVDARTGSRLGRALQELRRRPGDNPLQISVTTLVILAGLITVRPIGTSGWPLVVAGLLPLNCLLLTVRHVPDTVLRRGAVPWLVLSMFAAGALTVLSREGTAYLFLFLLTGHAGLRLPPRQAAAIAVLAGLLFGAALYFRLGPGPFTVPWPVGLTAAAPVLIGMTSRTQRAAMRSAIEAAESASRATEAEARSAVLAERGRIARDVHDVLAHSLAGVNMQLELVDALLEAGDRERAREATTKAHNLVKESLRQAQWTVHALREDALPLLESLQRLLESSGQEDVLMVHGVVREVPAKIGQNVLRIVQEALTNAARHAPGAGVRVQLDYRPFEIALSVRNTAAVRPAMVDVGSGLGLIGMRERVALLGGTITAGPVTEGPDAGGWEVAVVIPSPDAWCSGTEEGRR
jgi:signal transduction histidine kinase